MNDSLGLVSTAAGGLRGGGREDDARSVVRIGLLWHSSNSGNLGVGALTVANMAIIGEVARTLDIRPLFTVVQMRDGEISYVSEDDADICIVNTRSLLDPRGVWSTLRRQHCIIDIGAGDSFADIYGAKRFAYLWLTKIMAIAGRRPLLLAPQTIGPFDSPIFKGLARVALERARAVVARDHLSLKVLHELTPRARAVLAADVAFALPYEDRSSRRGRGALRVGVNVSGLLFRDAETGRNRFGLSFDYARVMRRYIAELVARPGVEVHLIPHVVSREMADDDDGLVARRLNEEFPGAILVEQFAGPSEAKSYISSLDFLVAARMHACIAAFSAGVPVAPVAYSRKFSGLFGMLDYSWVIPVKGLDEDGVLAKLNAWAEQRETLAEQTFVGMQKANDLLQAYRSELREMLLAVGART